MLPLMGPASWALFWADLLRISEIGELREYVWLNTVLVGYAKN
jgi:hypothetical protein